MINSYYPSSQTPITLSANSTIEVTINSPLFSPFDRAVDALLHLKIGSTNYNLNNLSSFPESKVFLKDNNNVTIDNAQLKGDDNLGWHELFFDVTKMYVQ